MFVLLYPVHSASCSAIVLTIVKVKTFRIGRNSGLRLDWGSYFFIIHATQHILTLHREHNKLSNNILTPIITWGKKLLSGYNCIIPKSKWPIHDLAFAKITRNCDALSLRTQWYLSPMHFTKLQLDILNTDLDELFIPLPPDRRQLRESPIRENKLSSLPCPYLNFL